MPYIIKKECTKCAACLPECPTGSIYEGKTQYYIDTDTCDDYAACVNVCPVDAIIILEKPVQSQKPKTVGDEEEEEEEE